MEEVVLRPWGAVEAERVLEWVYPPTVDVAPVLDEGLDKEPSSGDVMEEDGVGLGGIWLEVC